MSGHCILSHGFESGPDAAKVTALAAVATDLGWSCERPDYTDLDARREAGPHGDVPARIARLRTRARAAAARGPLLLAGSSLGAYISGVVSQDVAVAGLFLLAPPVAMPGAPPMPAAAVPLALVHGWHDDLIPAEAVIAWARPRRAQLLLVDDGHRLTAHTQTLAAAFADFLRALASQGNPGPWPWFDPAPEAAAGAPA